jgi:hypothetical protein
MRTGLAFLIGGLLGIVAGAGGMLIAFPFLFPLPIVSDPVSEMAGLRRAQTFKFDESAPGRDSIHWANGTGAIYRADGASVLRLDDTFAAGPGPNYWIYLNTTPVGDEDTFLADSGRLRIAPLKSFKGSQNFALPKGLDLAPFQTVTVWCETFSAYIGSAALPKS